MCNLIQEVPRESERRLLSADFIILTYWNDEPFLYDNNYVL